MKNPFNELDPTLQDLIKRTGSSNREEALAAQYELGRAIEGALREGILAGDIATNVFQSTTVGPTDEIEYPLDVLAPGEEDEFVAYTNPGVGRIPERTAEADYVKIPTYGVANSIDWPLKIARQASYDIIGRYLQILEAGFVKKINDDGWHTILAAVADRNILIYDADASAGQFTKREVSLMKTVMRRNGGGNTASLRRFKLTDLFMSPECVEDMRNWGVDIVDEVTRREIYIAQDGSLNRIFSVNLHELDELGEDQEYQDFFTDILGGTLGASDTELLIGLDMSNASFIMPIRQQIQLFEDPGLHRQQRAGYYGWGEWGFGVLDNRTVLAGSC